MQTRGSHGKQQNEMEHETVQSEKYIPKFDPNGLEIHETRYQWYNQREFKFTCVSHYTSIDSAIKILIPEGLSFRLSRFDCMNDPTDCRLAEEVLPLIRETAKKLIPYEEEQKSENIYPYVLSFCKSEDSFDMWKLYHSEAALVIDVKEALAPFKNPESPNALLIAEECRYCSSKEGIHQTAIELIGQSEEIINRRREMVQIQFALIKHKVFSVEDEFRIVIYDQDGFCIHQPEEGSVPMPEDKEIPNRVDAYCRANGQLVLFKTLVLPKEALKKIILRIDSHEEFSLKKKSLEVLLTQRGYYGVKIEKSKSPSFKETH